MESRTDNDKKAIGYFPFLVTYRDAIDELEEKDQLELYKAITDYGLYMVEPQTSNAVVRAVFKVLKPLLDRSHTNRMNGKQGGGKKGNQNARKTSEKRAKTSEKRAKTSENEQSGFSGDITYNKEPIKPIKPIEQTTNNTENENDVVDVVVESPRQKVLDSVSDFVWLDKFAYQYNVDCQTARNLAERVIADWELANIADDQWTQSHLLNAMRKKLEADNKSLAQSTPTKQDEKAAWERDLARGAMESIRKIYSGVTGTSTPQKDMPY